MKACMEYLEMMNAVLDGEASPAEQAELTAHLEHCPACAALFEDLHALHEGADTLTVSAPAGFADRVMDAVRAESARPALKVLPTPKRRKRWMPVAAMAAVCALALIGSGSLETFLSIDRKGAAAPEAAYTSLSDAVKSSPASAPQAAAPAEAPVSASINDSTAYGGQTDAAGQTVSAAPEKTADDAGTALDMVIERIFGDSGYTLEVERTASDLPCRVRLLDGDKVIDESTVTYTGISPNGKFYCFNWTWEGQSPEDSVLFRYAVDMDLSYVMWAGETMDGGVLFLAALEN